MSGTDIYTNYQYEYNERGKVQSITFIDGNVTHYLYDSLDRLIEEKVVLNNNQTAKHLKYSYNINGELQSIHNGLQNDAVIKSFHYVEGRLNKVSTPNLITNVQYDNYGNPTAINDTTLSFSHGTCLSSYGNIQFIYNHEGLRTKKITLNKTIVYLRNKTLLLGEIHSDG